MAALGAAGGALVAGACLEWYVGDILIRQAGEPDRSMVFWGLPIAFLGVASLVVAGVLARTAQTILRRDR